jgi:hypothetical protein
MNTLYMDAPRFVSGWWPFPPLLSESFQLVSVRVNDAAQPGYAAACAWSLQLHV